MSSGVVFLLSMPGASSMLNFRYRCCTKAEQYMEDSRAMRLARERNSWRRKASRVPKSSRTEYFARGGDVFEAFAQERGDVLVVQAEIEDG